MSQNRYIIPVAYVSKVFQRNMEHYNVQKIFLYIFLKQKYNDYTKQTSIITNNDPSKQDVEAIINELEKHEQTLQRIKLTFKKIEINIKRNTNELSPMITATMSNDDDNNVETIEHVNYPKGLTSGLLNAINKFISNYNYQDVGKVRIITIRTLIKLFKLIINNNTKINIDDDDLTHKRTYEQSCR